MSASDNKELIRRGFEAWARGEGDVFHLLADGVLWTITGSSPVAGTYCGRQDFLDQVIHPIAARLAKPIRPTVRRIVAEGDHVVVLWDGNATALDGQPYNNSYCWVMRLEHGKVTEAVAFFDAPPLVDLWERVKPPVR